MKKGSNPLISAFRDHFGRAWSMLAEMIGNVPDNQWTKRGQGQVTPVHLVVHMVVGAEVFLADIPLETYDPTEFLGQAAPPGGPWTIPPQDLWSKDVALQKLDEMRAIVDQLLTQLDDAALSEPEDVHPWTGKTRLGKLLYELRHIQHHLGELDAELSRRGIQGYQRWD